MVETTATEQNIEKRVKINEDSLKDLWNNINTRTFTLKGSQEQNREKGPEKIFEEIIAENFPNMEKEIINQVLEAHRVPGKIDRRTNTPRHRLFKLTKIKDEDKLLKTTREQRQITNKGKPIRLSAYFSMETLQARREWHKIFKVMKGKNLKPRIPSKALTQI